MRPGDAEVVARLLARREHASWWAPTRPFFEEAPERVAVARDAEDRLCGYVIAVTAANAPGFADDDPLLGRWLARARSHDPNAVLFRDSVDFTTGLAGDASSRVQAMVNLAGILRSELTNPRFAYLPVNPLNEAAVRFTEAVGATHLPELDARTGDHEIHCYLLDHGPGGVLGLQRDVMHYECGRNHSAQVACTAAMAEPRHTLIKTASYEADPEEVGRVLLLYSGGLDTSVMLKWIQDEYEAEVVALTVNLGQPGEDYEVVRGKALHLGALECHVIDAREEFAHEYVLPAIKANGLYGGGYPLFTALGRPLIAKLAVEQARASGCDTIAHGCTGKGNDQVRIESTVIAVDPEMKIIAPVRGWQMGREEEIAYAREHGIPVKGGTETPPYSIDDNLWGRSSEGGPIEDLDEPPHDDVFQLVTRPEEAPDEPEDVVVGFEEGVPVSLTGSAWDSWS